MAMGLVIQSLLRRVKRKVTKKKHGNDTTVLNKLDSQVWAAFKPLYILTLLFFCPKYGLSDKLIFPKGIVFYMQLILGLAGALTLVCNYLKQVFGETINNTSIFFVFNVSYFFFYYVILVLLNFVSSNSNVTVILKINDFVKTMNGRDFGDVIRWNWKLFAFYLLYFYSHRLIIYLCFNVSMYQLLDWMAILHAFLISYLDINILYLVCVIRTLTKCFKEWEYQATKFIKYDILEGLMEERRANDIIKCYLILNEAYEEFQKLIQGLVLFHVAGCCFQVVLNITYALLIDYIVMHFVASTLIWMSKNIILEVMLGIECEKFYGAKEHISAMCSTDIGTYSGNKKQVLKKILLMNKYCFQKLTIYGYLDLDVNLSFKVVEFIAAYTIVILQFALSKKS